MGLGVGANDDLNHVLQGRKGGRVGGWGREDLRALTGGGKLITNKNTYWHF